MHLFLCIKTSGRAETPSLPYKAQRTANSTGNATKTKQHCMGRAGKQAPWLIMQAIAFLMDCYQNEAKRRNAWQHSQRRKLMPYPSDCNTHNR